MTRAALLLLLLTGCQAAPQAVEIRNERSGGWGVPVTDYQVLTVSHILGKRNQVRTFEGWRPAKVVKIIVSKNGESLALLEVSGNLPPPVRLISRARKGTSGYPVIDHEGRVFGLVSGVKGDTTTIVGCCRVDLR